MENNSFVEFLNKKKIDSSRFQKSEATVFMQWKEEFAQMHEESFVMLKKFSINAIRRKYNSRL